GVFFIQLSRSIIEIRRTDDRPFAIHNHELAVNESGAILINLDAGLQQILVMRLRAEPDESIVDVLTGKQNADIHTLTGFCDKRRFEMFVGNEIGRNDKQALSGSENRHKEELSHRVAVRSR